LVNQQLSIAEDANTDLKTQLKSERSCAASLKGELDEVESAASGLRRRLAGAEQERDTFSTEAERLRAMDADLRDELLDDFGPLLQAEAWSICQEDPQPGSGAVVATEVARSLQAQLVGRSEEVVQLRDEISIAEVTAAGVKAGLEAEVRAVRSRAEHDRQEAMAVQAEAREVLHRESAALELRAAMVSEVAAESRAALAAHCARTENESLRMTAAVAAAAAEISRHLTPKSETNGDIVQGISRDVAHELTLASKNSSSSGSSMSSF